MSTMATVHELRVTGRVPQAVALAFLKGAPRENVFLIARIRAGGMETSKDAAHGFFLGAFDEDQSLRGLCFVGNSGLLVISVDEPWVAGTFAEPLAERGARINIAVMENGASREFLARYREAGGAKPSLDRKQPYYIVDRRSLIRRGIREIDMEQASLDSIDELTELACDMVAEDFKLDPARMDRRFHRLRMTEKVMDGRAFLCRDEQGKPMFKCDFSVLGPEGALLEGVFTPRHLRRKGLAARAILTVAKDLLEHTEVPFIALHVYDRNRGARRTYEKIGFQHVADFRLMLWPSHHRSE